MGDGGKEKREKQRKILYASAFGLQQENESREGSYKARAHVPQSEMIATNRTVGAIPLGKLPSLDS